MSRASPMRELLANRRPSDLGLSAFGSQRGGEAAYRLYPLLLSCKQCGADPEAYTEDVLMRVATTPASEIASLTPLGVAGGAGVEVVEARGARQRWSDMASLDAYCRRSSLRWNEAGIPLALGGLYLGRFVREGTEMKGLQEKL